jgi:adenylate kinase family enzyme
MEVAPGPCVLIVSGPPGAGKTTVSAELATRFAKSVHLKTDTFYEFIKGGFLHPWQREAASQNEVVVRAVARAAAVYAAAAYTVIIDGVVLPWALAVYRTELAREGIDVRCVVLLPDVEVATRRGLARIPAYNLEEPVYRESHRQFVDAYRDDEVPMLRDLGRVEEVADRALAKLGVS